MGKIQLYGLAGFQLLSEKAGKGWNSYFCYFAQVEVAERGKRKASPDGQGLEGKRSGENLMCLRGEKGVKMGLGKRRAILLIS